MVLEKTLESPLDCKDPGGTVAKSPPANAGDTRDAGLICGSGRPPLGGNGNPLQYSCLENPMDRRAWWATVRGVAKSQIQLKQLSSSSSSSNHKGASQVALVEKNLPAIAANAGDAGSIPGPEDPL